MTKASDNNTLSIVFPGLYEEQSFKYPSGGGANSCKFPTEENNCTLTKISNLEVVECVMSNVNTEALAISIYSKKTAREASRFLWGQTRVPLEVGGCVEVTCIGHSDGVLNFEDGQAIQCTQKSLSHSECPDPDPRRCTNYTKPERRKKYFKSDVIAPIVNADAWAFNDCYLQAGDPYHPPPSDPTKPPPNNMGQFYVTCTPSPPR